MRIFSTLPNHSGVMEVQRRNNFVIGSDNTEIISWGQGGIKLNNLIQGRNCFCFALELDGDASPLVHSACLPPKTPTSLRSSL